MRRAVAEGLVRAERRGPRRTHVPVRERAYLARMWPLLGALRQALRTEPNVRLAVLYGSVARGDDRSDSDVDLLVALGDPDRVRVYDLRDRVATRVDRDVQVVGLDEAERAPWLLAEIAHEGRSIRLAEVGCRAPRQVRSRRSRGSRRSATRV